MHEDWNGIVHIEFQPIVTYDISHSKITTQVSTWVTAVLVGMWSGHSTCTTAVAVVRVNFYDF